MRNWSGGCARCSRERDGIVLRDRYLEFLRAKTVVAPQSGLDIDPSELHACLKPHQRDIAAWMIRGGSRACFASFGLGKTFIQIEALRCILRKLHGDKGGSGLIVCPLGVRAEFIRDARKYFGIEFVYVRTNDEHANLTASGHRFFVSNYERVRDGALDPNRFDVVSLDEASILRSFGSKTYQTFLGPFNRVRFKFVCTATPDPNRHKELIHYAGFLGVMDTGQALTRFFKRDSSQAGNLQLHEHKKEEFWLWVSSWAVFIERPSDLGYSDEGYVLPGLRVIQHRLPVNHAGAGFDSWGQGKLLRNAAVSISDGAREKRDSLPSRIACAKQIIEAAPADRHWIIWHDLEAEREAIEIEIPEAVTVYGTQDLEEREASIADFTEGKFRILATKPIIAGSGCNFQRHCFSAIYLGIGFKFNDFIQSCHRLLRFLQASEVEIHLIYTESEDNVYQTLMAKWERHKAQVETMTEIIRKYGLSAAELRTQMERSIGVERQVHKGELCTLVNNDNVLEARSMADASIDLIVTSWPFSDHYEYTESI